MIVETYPEEGRVRHMSDRGVMLRQVETGVLYEDSVDVLPCRYTYEETEDLTPAGEEEAQIPDYEAALGRLGVAL